MGIRVQHGNPMLAALAGGLQRHQDREAQMDLIKAQRKAQRNAQLQQAFLNVASAVVNEYIQPSPIELADQKYLAEMRRQKTAGLNKAGLEQWDVLEDQINEYANDPSWQGKAGEFLISTLRQKQDRLKSVGRYQAIAPPKDGFEAMARAGYYPVDPANPKGEWINPSLTGKERSWYPSQASTELSSKSLGDLLVEDRKQWDSAILGPYPTQKRTRAWAESLGMVPEGTFFKIYGHGIDEEIGAGGASSSDPDAVPPASPQSREGVPPLLQRPGEPSAMGPDPSETARFLAEKDEDFKREPGEADLVSADIAAATTPVEGMRAAAKWGIPVGNEEGSYRWAKDLPKGDTEKLASMIAQKIIPKVRANQPLTPDEEAWQITYDALNRAIAHNRLDKVAVRKGESLARDFWSAASSREGAGAKTLEFLLPDKTWGADVAGATPAAGWILRAIFPDADVKDFDPEGVALLEELLRSGGGS